MNRQLTENDVNKIVNKIGLKSFKEEEIDRIVCEIYSSNMELDVIFKICDDTSVYLDMFPSLYKNNKDKINLLCHNLKTLKKHKVRTTEDYVSFMKKREKRKLEKEIEEYEGKRKHYLKLAKDCENEIKRIKQELKN